MSATAVHELLVAAHRWTLNELARRLATPGGSCGWHVTDHPDGVRLTVYGTDDLTELDELADRDAAVPVRHVAGKVRQVEHVITDLAIRRSYTPTAVVAAAVRAVAEKVDAWEATR